MSRFWLRIIHHETSSNTSFRLLTNVVCVAVCIGSGKPFMIGVYSLFWNFCGGGIVSTRAGNCVNGNCRFLLELVVFFGLCAGETLQRKIIDY